MKTYRKKWIGILMAMLLCFSPVSAFAAETQTQVTIASGLDMKKEEIECTFDDSRIIYGEAAPNTKITFTVSKMNRFGAMIELYANTVTVGSMGLFTATLPLERGNNHITMIAESTGLEKTIETVVVKRVPQTVKQQLQRMIALPGLNMTL